VQALIKIHEEGNSLHSMDTTTAPVSLREAYTIAKCYNSDKPCECKELEVDYHDREDCIFIN
jgi:hypothetical protein